MAKKTILFLGFGYTAQFTAKILERNGYEVFGTTRGSTKIVFPGLQNIKIIKFEPGAIKSVINRVDHIVISVPPIESNGIYSDPSLDMIQSIISNDNDQLKSITYLSSTGVYGDHQGKWIDETTTPLPDNTRSKARLKAEHDWQKLCAKHDISLKIFRLSGIYGPGRNALSRVKSGMAQSIYKQGQVFGRIHVEDIANILYKMFNVENNISGIFNISDDYPCSTIEVNNFAAKLLNVSEPAIIDIENANLSEMGKEFYSACKRVKNDKIKEALSIELIYPSYKQGLQSIYHNGAVATVP